jgi:hypothetical protein
MDAPPDKSPPVVEAGYVALEAGDVDAAVALLESRPDFLCCLRTSTCPEAWTGLKLADAVRDRWPPIKILLVSGKVRLHPFELASNICFAGKPYRAAAMVEKLPSIVRSA